MRQNSNDSYPGCALVVLCKYGIHSYLFVRKLLMIYSYLRVCQATYCQELSSTIMKPLPTARFSKKIFSSRLFCPKVLPNFSLGLEGKVVNLTLLYTKHHISGSSRSEKIDLNTGPCPPGMPNAEKSEKMLRICE